MLLGTLAGLFHTGAAVINIDLTKRIGMKSVLLQVIGAISTFFMFHALKNLIRNKE